MEDKVINKTGSYFKGSSISASDFTAWTSKNQYRTSSLDMSQKFPAAPKTYAIPGYAGYIPGLADTPLEKNFTVISKEQFCRDTYLPARTTDSFPNRPLGGGLEDEYHTISRFHGKSTIPITHPNYQDNLWLTSSSFSYVNQEKLRPKIYRKTNYSPTKSQKVSNRAKTAASGFVQNSTLFDGHGWLPIEKLHGDMTVSEYRNRFNAYVPFHPKQRPSHTRTLKKKPLVY